MAALLRGGPRNQAAAWAAAALADVVANNGINQDAVADAGGVEQVVELLSAAVACLKQERQAFDCSLFSGLTSMYYNIQPIASLLQNETRVSLALMSCIVALHLGRVCVRI